MRIVIYFDHLSFGMNKVVTEGVAQKLYDSIECVGQIRTVELVADDDITVIAHKSKYDADHMPISDISFEPHKEDSPKPLIDALMNLEDKLRRECPFNENSAHVVKLARHAIENQPLREALAVATALDAIRKRASTASIAEL